MDIGDILAFKPSGTPKRPYKADSNDEDEEEDDHERQSRKMPKPTKIELQREKRVQKIKEELEKQAMSNLKADVRKKEQLKIQNLIENTVESEQDSLTEVSLKKLILTFEKRCFKNREMRIKFPDHPEKFMEAETELFEIIQELQAVAAVPDLFPILVDLNAVTSLLELLSHENTDIAVAVVNLLQEVTDIDILHESQEGADVLIDSLLNHQVYALLVQNMERLDESIKEEADGVHNTLAVFENLTEFRPEICADAASNGLFAWLLRRLRVKAPFDANKLYASELLSILLQDTPENRQLIGELDGIDVILQQLAFYKRHDPTSDEETEMMENLFNCLCSCLVLQSNRDKFVNGEGLQLMNLMLREKKLSRNGSLKVLDHAMSGPNRKENANKFVDILGLRTIFPLFMKTPRRNRRKFMSVEEHEEHVVSIICNLVKNCKGAQRQRLLSKFTENDHEKVDRLLELHFKYLEKVKNVDAEIDENERLDHQKMEADDAYLKRLNGGLFTLQLIDYIVIEVSACGPTTVKQRVMQMINLRGGSLKVIRQIMREYAGNLGEAEDESDKDVEQQHILQLIDKF